MTQLDLLILQQQQSVGWSSTATLITMWPFLSSHWDLLESAYSIPIKENAKKNKIATLLKHSHACPLSELDWKRKRPQEWFHGKPRCHLYLFNPKCWKDNIKKTRPSNTGALNHSRLRKISCKFLQFYQQDRQNVKPLVTTWLFQCTTSQTSISQALQQVYWNLCKQLFSISLLKLTRNLVISGLAQPVR